MDKQFLKKLADYNKSVLLDEFIFIIREGTFSTYLVRNLSFNQYNLLFTNNSIKKVYPITYENYDKEVVNQYKKGYVREYITLK